MVSLNCDMGESFGQWRFGDDEGILPFVDCANIACGFHASDPATMAKTVRLAVDLKKKIGAHPSLPDREGFGRREMHLTSDELTAAFIYQIGALHGFLLKEGASLSHVKPHGIIYGMAARDMTIALAIAAAVKPFGVPLFGMVGTCHEDAARQLDVPFIGEFFGDLSYSPEGKLIIPRTHAPVDLDRAASRLSRALDDGVVEATDGTILPVSFGTVCIHSDPPNARAVAERLRAVLNQA
ncbi:5-oxoprolinase subunit PxpA [Gemmobacter fulvus]|uniref:5-oxoprolinase subunit PxpA n=1 Tax=Gemmobacter fulvus TaxID=2840474 RepID=UPI00279674A0|nr:5-oxoprolinase subunit PxpA [Gemmobacter fulvus]MDQ1850613.1 5-oxoprolinase subunit PxpA [Gemmobacter fulvus]